MAFGLSALLLACLWFHTLPDPPTQFSSLSLSSSSTFHSSIRCVSYASNLLPTAVDSMKCNTVSILASSNRISKSCRDLGLLGRKRAQHRLTFSSPFATPENEVAYALLPAA
jgi:hypothetical protein